MGLDAQLHANRLLSPIEEATIDNTVRDVVQNLLDLKGVRYKTMVSIDVGEFRRPHPAHDWILANARIGLERDGSNRYHLVHSQIRELRDRCAQAMGYRSLAGLRRPLTRGTDLEPDTEIDERCVHGLKAAYQVAEEALKLDEAEWEFEYSYSA